MDVFSPEWETFRRHCHRGVWQEWNIPTTLLYLGFLLQPKARWTLVRLVRLVIAQIDIFARRWKCVLRRWEHVQVGTDASFYSRGSRYLVPLIVREKLDSGGTLRDGVSDRASAASPETRTTVRPVRGETLHSADVWSVSSGRGVLASMFWCWPQGRIDCAIEVIGNQIRQNVPPYFEADEVSCSAPSITIALLKLLCIH